MTGGPGAQAAFAATLVDEWARAGVRHAVIAPGSRSTPLTLALAADGRLRLHVVLDERSAGFVALGLGLGAGRPAVVVTTSGTAAVELHPAVVEAHHAGVALIAVTADRPPELQGVGAPQTVDQRDLFGPAVRWADAPGVADWDSAPSWRSLGSRSVWESTSGPRGPGPVHLNLAFREPLVGQPAGSPPGRAGGRPWHRVGRAEAAAGPPDVVDRLAHGGRGARGLIVAGGGAGDPDQVHLLASALGWPVLADPRSGCRLPSPLTIAAADALLRTGPVAAWRPEVVLRLGRPWASRVVNSWLAGLGPDVEQWLVDPDGAWPDPERVASVVVGADPTALCRAVAEAVGGAPAAAGVSGGRPGGSWARTWSAAEAAAQRAIADVLGAHAEPTEPGIARDLAAALPDGARLFCSSSMPVRDLEWYAAPADADGRSSPTGGPTGSTASCRAPSASPWPTRPAPPSPSLGDLAFLYDAGALLGAAGRGVSLTMVVVDNDGGGIFSFLPQASAVPAPTFEQLWGTPHGIDLAQVAGAYGITTQRVHAAADLAPAVMGALAAGGVRVVLVRTDRDTNVAIHDEIHAAVAGRWPPWAGQLAAAP